MDARMRCKFYEDCEYASSTALTCSEGGGGNYCGKYRLLAYGYTLQEQEVPLIAIEIPV